MSEAEAVQSTSDIVSQVIESSEAEPAETPVDAAPVETAAPVPAVTQSAEDAGIEALLSEFGFKEAYKPDGREHYIPRSKVLRMIGSGLKRGQEKWGTEKGTYEQQVKEAQEALSGIRQGIAGDPKGFLSELAQFDPRYQEALRAIFDPQPAVPAPQPQVSVMPDPDVTMADGSRTYSIDGLKKLLEWNTQQVKQQLIPEVDARLKPWMERDEKERVRAIQAAQAEERTMKQMAEAQTWPMFGTMAADGSLNPFQTEVLEIMKADKSVDLRGAYIKVIGTKIPELTEQNAQAREKLAKEASAAATSTPTVGRSGGETPKPSKPRTTAEIVASVVNASE